MSKVVLYSQEISPPCRSVLMTAHAIGLDLEIREMNLLKGDHMSEEFKKINPQHTIPTMNDNGFVLWDSHAISCYLLDKYAKDDSLYPKDLQKRALINQRLHFDSGVLFAVMKNAFKPVFLEEVKSVPPEKMDAMTESYEILDKFLEGKEWLVGDSYTLADISCVTTVSNGTAVLKLDNYPNVKAWLKRCEEQLPGYKECNIPGMKALHKTLLSKLA